jgi:uncharacterized protein (TIGR04168 family)
MNFMVNIGIIGDIHHYFTSFDVDYFNHSIYDLLLCTGDLPYHGTNNDKQVVGLLATLQKPTLLIPGNHDCVNTAQFIAEAKGVTWLADRTNPQQQQLVEELRRGLGLVVMGGYSSHDYHFGDLDFCVMAARPLSFGGPDLSYRRYLQTNFSIDNLQSSAKRLQELIDATEASQILFLSHNGPTGLGALAEDIWCCDFKPQAGDYGDPDLRAAINYAKERGKKVTAVIAGHMHHALVNGGHRKWLVRQDNTCYINAARVPRIFEIDATTIHHHIHLNLDKDGVLVEEKLIAKH